MVGSAVKPSTQKYRTVYMTVAYNAVTGSALWARQSSGFRALEGATSVAVSPGGSTVSSPGPAQTGVTGPFCT